MPDAPQSGLNELPMPSCGAYQQPKHECEPKRADDAIALTVESHQFAFAERANGKPPFVKGLVAHCLDSPSCQNRWPV